MLLTKKITLLIIKKVDWVTGEEQQKLGAYHPDHDDYQKKENVGDGLRDV